MASIDLKALGRASTLRHDLRLPSGSSYVVTETHYFGSQEPQEFTREFPGTPDPAYNWNTDPVALARQVQLASYSFDVSVSPVASEADVVDLPDKTQLRVPEGLAIIRDTLTANGGYLVEFYRAADVAAKAGGQYPLKPSVNAVSRWQVDDPFVGGVAGASVRVTEQDRPDPLKTTHIQTATGWLLKHGDSGPTEEIIERAVAAGQVTQTVVSRSPGGTVDSSRTQIVNANGKIVTTVDGLGNESTPQPGDLRTDYTYNAGRLESVERSDGTYEKYEWVGSEDAPSYTRTTIRPWLDLSKGQATAANSRVTVEQHLRSGTGEEITVIEKIAGTVVSQVVTASSLEEDSSQAGFPLHQVQRVSTRRQASGAPENLIVTRTIIGGGDPRLAGKPLESRHEDGTFTRHSYRLGTISSFAFQPGAGADLESMEWRVPMGFDGGPGSPIANITTRHATYESALGRLICEEEQICADASGTFETMNNIYHSYDADGNEISVARRDAILNSLHYISVSTCDHGRKVSETDETGVTTVFSEFDSPDGHVRQTVRQALASVDGLSPVPELTTQSISDGAGRTIKEITSSPGVPNRVRTTLYDSRGRVKETAEGGDDAATRLVTTTTYNGLVTTVTLPGGTPPGTITQISQNWLDGQAKSTGGTGTVAETKEYQVVAGNLIRETTKRGSTAQSQYVESVSESNGLGMLIREKTASPTEGWRSFTYDSAGRRTSEKLGGDTLATYSYPDPHTTVSTQFATPDPARTHTQTQTYVKQDGAWWRVSTSDGASQWEKVGPFNPGEISVTRQIDADGRVSTSTTTAYAGDGFSKTTSYTAGVANPSIATSRAGLVVRTVEPGGHTTTTTCDGFGRPLETIASETGLHTSFAYDPVTGQVGTQRSWSGVPNYANAADRTETINTYCTKAEATPGRLKTRSVDGVVTNFAYTPRGELLAQWGATYPVKYEYDAAGRMGKLNTYRMNDPSSNPAANWSPGDVTEWTYHPGTELLWKKKDAAGKETAYAYDTAGRMSTRIWVRTVGGQPLTTAYSYNLAGDMRLIHYSDPAMTDVVTTHDARGRVATIADGSGTRAFTYTLAGLPLNEDTAAGRSLQWSYDAAGRKAGYALWEQGAFQTWGGWGYSPATGKTNGVSTREGWVTDTETPATGGGTTRTLTRATPGTISTKTQRDGLGRPRASDTLVGAATPSRLAARRYDYNTAGRLVTTREGDATASTFTERSRWAYGYNTRGEVAAASAKWADNTAVAGEQFGTAGPSGAVTLAGYVFDLIGNRSFSTVNGRTSTWYVNNINQVTTRYTSTNAFDVLGEAAPAPATVRVNGALVPEANRHGANFYAAVPVSISSYNEPRWLTLTVQEQKAGNPTPSPTSTTGSVYAPPYAENPTYDFDGNLTTDGRWAYTWDAENRLIAMTSRWDSTPSTGMPKERLVFKYDSEGRRTVKEYYTRTSATGTGSAWVLQRRIHFRYEGWNLIAEYSETLNAQPSTLNLLRSYAWGEDLSGTVQGAGGVGGLVLLSTHSPAGVVQSYWPAMDNVGNVHALINLLSGEVAAEYEYGPFGEPLRATGAMAKANPFRFSTHYTDDETGLVYAKRRYYSTSSGRWLSKDPIGERGGKNLYGYVNNQPTARFDPFGLFHANANECGVCMVKSIRVVYKGFRGPAANDPFDGAHHTFHTIVELYPAGENLQPIGIRSDPSRCRFRQEVKGYSTFDGEFQKFTAGDSHSGEKPPISPNSFVDDQYSNADNHGTDLVWEFHDSPGISPQKPVSLQDLPPVPGALTWIDWFLEFKAIVEDENPKTGRRSKVAEKSGHWLSIKGYWPNVTGDHGGF